MPSDPPPPSAARRLAAHARYASEPMRQVLSEDLRTCLPVFEAVADGQDDEGRVERMARVLCRAAGHDPEAPFGPEGHCLWESFDPQARAAMALADAERAAAAADGWKAYRKAQGDLVWVVKTDGGHISVRNAVDALDAAVRRLAG